MIIEHLKAQYQSLNTENLSALMALYTPDVEFRDPLHQISGQDQLRQYFEKLLTNTLSCEFEFHQSIIQNQQATLSWTMSFSHRQLNRQRPIHVEGCSWLRFNQLVYFHRDYFDVSTLLHDQLPLLGSFSKWLKNRSGQ
ncbi:nuclear transport factor 2 family protein [Celerinatantimonas diazotrophica]|uniref:SnoaL-like protein n=1 Tax=Celerinatantimonas diazotrophica TaxID=412034 RepID=A0A4R1K2J1_9GAMM|nr:nuclear transport factor 2 family protein [Celerinatantimonas diazotrophica]TCK58150.1 SnoaL-like protein [Celerinatantimonas diazotrophica]CAG9297778.1 hypothetical protein CEDIAZO_02969 [Celerinatantimonas diazotrophica]